MELWQQPATELWRRLESRELSAVELCESLIARRLEVDPALGAFVAICDDALERARHADDARGRGEATGPLAGMPFTIKDNVDLEGHDSTLGIASRVGAPAERDAVLTETLRRAGAVFLGKTNVPQALLAQETENQVFGVTRNPWNTARTPGGSSGGEAAAVASGMSPLGIGTDIGGSIRIPAHFSGIVGFKPTLDRWSNRGSSTAIPGQELVRPQIGCLARNVGDVAFLWSRLDPRAMSAGDPAVPPLAAGDPAAVDLSGLRVGLVTDDVFLPPTASLRRAVERAGEALEAAGAQVAPYTPVPTAEVLSLWLSALTSDGGRTLDRALGRDPISPQLRPSRTLMRVPAPLRRAASLVLGGIGQERLSLLLDVLGEKSVADLWRITSQRSALRHAEIDAWNREGFDAVVCPPHVVAALSHRDSSDYALSVGAEFRWTLLDFPAGVVPVTRVLADEVGHYPESDRITAKTARIDRESVGLPVGAQVVARPYREDVMLAVMNAIEAGVSGDPGYPVTPVTPATR